TDGLPFMTAVFNRMARSRLSAHPRPDRMAMSCRRSCRRCARMRLGISAAHHRGDLGSAHVERRLRNKLESIIMTRLGRVAFNYDVVAELFPTKDNVTLFSARTRRVRRQPIGYGRFARAAYAIRFAIEELPVDLLSETCLQVDERIFDGNAIRRLYESENYPLARRANASTISNLKYFPRK